MEKWNKKDIGKVIVYRTQSDSGWNEKVAICNTDPYCANSVLAINYPIDLKSNIRYLIYLNKDQEVKEKKQLKSAGDWYFEGKASKEELEELVRIGSKSIFFSDIY